MSKRAPQRWTDAEVAVLRALYPTHTTAYVAAQCGHPTGSTHLKAFALGLKKAPTFYRRREALDTLKKHGQPFHKGYMPANAIYHLPLELRVTIQTLSKLQRTIREKQDRGLAQSPVCDAGGAAG